MQDIRPGAGLASLLTDGSNDYGYQEHGTGAAPTSAWNPATGQRQYLSGDPLGSVHLVTDPSGALTGADAYDAWGSARPNQGTAAGSGATLLAWLTGSQPFRFAGQYLDAGAGTYDMRPREYDPSQGRFQSQDPQPYDPQVPVTINPYEFVRGYTHTLVRQGQSTRRVSTH